MKFLLSLIAVIAEFGTERLTSRNSIDLDNLLSMVAAGVYQKYKISLP